MTVPKKEFRTSHDLVEHAIDLSKNPDLRWDEGRIIFWPNDPRLDVPVRKEKALNDKEL